jgi:hypothetical protein
MTFPVSQDAEVLQKDLRERTLEAADSIRSYDPDETWTRVIDLGDDDPADGPVGIASEPGLGGVPAGTQGR